LRNHISLHSLDWGGRYVYPEAPSTIRSAL
jgi:hypothetical protein